MKTDEGTENGTTNVLAARPVLGTQQLRRILVAIDFFPGSQWALAYARVVAAKFAARITLIHVVEARISPETLMVTAAMEVDMRTVQDCQEMLSAMALTGKPADQTAEAVVKTGEAWEEIVAEASFLRADLIVTASHGHSALADVFLGNTAERVLRHAPCSVLTLRQRAAQSDAAAWPAIGGGKILVAFDFSPGARVALANAVRLAKQFAARLLIVYVIETEHLVSAFAGAPQELSVAEVRMVKEGEEALACFARHDIPADIDCQTLVRLGPAHDVISQTAAELAVDLIIINASARRGWKDTLLGSTAERVVRHAVCAVWTVRGDETDLGELPVGKLDQRKSTAIRA